MNGQRDVDVPRCLRHRLGSLLACFEKHLQGRVVKQWRVYKEPGGHVTSWWIYAQLSPAAVSSSVVVFGETDHAEVNAVPHLWIRGKEKWIGDGFKLLRDFVSAERRAAELPPPPPQRPPPPLRSLARFDGREYGPEYLTFEAGVDVIPALPPVDAEGWEFGVVVATGARGWYPPQFVA